MLALGWLGWTLIGAGVLLLALLVLSIACYPRDNSF